jgi:hypothetical protein
MSKRSTQIGIAGLLAVFAALVSVSPALAQAGSTGGTIGKQGKSASGDEEAKKPRASGGIGTSAGKSRRTADRPCDKIVGKWRWVYGTEAIFDQNGTGRHFGSTANWTCTDGVVIATWNSGWVDRITISADGNSLSIVNNAGITFAASRK